MKKHSTLGHINIASKALVLDQTEVYNRYRVVPEIHGKIALANRRLDESAAFEILI